MSRRLTLLSESLLLGLMVFLASLPLVTAFAAVAAGCAVLRESERTPVGARAYARQLAAVARGGPLGFAAPVGLGAVLLLDWTAVRAGLPGHQLLAVLVPIVALAAAALALRCAAAWRPGHAWPRAARDAVRADLYGTGLLAMAVAVAAVVCATFPLVTPLALGQLVLAAAAVDARTSPARA
ncbi:hypothetical protein [Sphaerisporangium sp. TRM90804]|uniref:hypothetical protein n=1 Tax=Sphaerisporangium sp. TRM90804 TaxID=3031113 RepID=UPI002447809C|nr:hypothetical protein [Sphaerisporangium sp. TRM90804]MDH2424342.1 hypothetical protein [Sphaerisporangium sp. TRM90804]